MSVDDLSDSVSLPFKGHLSEEGQAAIRRLYLVRSKLYSVIYIAFSAAMIGFAVHAISEENLQNATLYILFAATLVYVAMFAPLVACKSWLREIAATSLDGDINPEGVFLSVRSSRIAWSSFIAAKVDEDTALLYTSKKDGIPLHCELFANRSSWESARQEILKSVKVTLILSPTESQPRRGDSV